MPFWSCRSHSFLERSCIFYHFSSVMSIVFCQKIHFCTIYEKNAQKKRSVLVKNATVLSWVMSQVKERAFFFPFIIYYIYASSCPSPRTTVRITKRSSHDANGNKMAVESTLKTVWTVAMATGVTVSERNGNVIKSFKR